MKTSEQSQQRAGFISAEAMVGLGFTVAWLGLLCLLLGWAEVLRQEMAVAWIWLPLGAIMMIAGLIAAMLGKSRKRG